MEAEFITVDEITQGVDAGLRPFLLIDAVPLPRTMLPIIEAFWTSTKVIAPTIQITKLVNVIFAANPFVVNLATGKLTYETSEGVINTYLNNTIFIDCNKLIVYNAPIQTACILEELVHAFMNVKDENLVTEIVGWLYDGVQIRDGQYCA